MEGRIRGLGGICAGEVWRAASRAAVGFAMALMLAISLAAPSLAADATSAADVAGRLVTQIDLALRHAGFAWQADARGLQLHTHHVVNIVAGSRSMHFQASFGNPGDGYGALEYARDLRASPEVASAGWADSARLVASWLEQALEHAVRAAAAAGEGNGDEARASLGVAVALLSAAKGRTGETAPVAGAIAVHQALQAAGPAEPAASSTGGHY